MEGSEARFARSAIGRSVLHLARLALVTLAACAMTQGIYGAVPVPATVDINPNTLNLKSKGKWITCYIELPQGYDVNDIDVTTLLLDGAVSASTTPVAIDDYDTDTITDLMVKFPRPEVIDLLGPELDVGSTETTVTVTVTGQVAGSGSHCS